MAKDEQTRKRAPLPTVERQAGNRLVSFSESENSGHFARAAPPPRGGGRFAALAVVLGAVLGVVFLSEEKEKPVTLKEALETLDAGLNDEAYEMGKKLQDAENLPDDSYGAPAFIMGAALAYEADRSFAGDKKAYYLLSARYLEQARDMGLPSDREGEGLYQLGRTLFLSGQVPASRPVFEEALEAAPRHRSEILWLLAEACLNDANPQYDQALAWNDKYLADRVLRPADRCRGQLQRAGILLGLGKKEECLATLQEIPDEAKDQAEALVIKAGVIMATADEMLTGEGVTPEQREAAEREIRRGHRSASGRPGTRHAEHPGEPQGDVSYGRVPAAQGRLQQGARSVLANGAGQSRNGGVAGGGFRNGRAPAHAGRSQGGPGRLHPISLAGREPDDYNNPWITLEDLQRRAVEAFEFYLKADAFETALLLAASMDPLLPESRVTELEARCRALWGRNLLATAQALESESLAAQQAAGREQLRRAGEAYARLAKLRIVTKSYTEDLWQSAQCYLEGHDYVHAVEAIQEYLNNGAAAAASAGPGRSRRRTTQSGANGRRPGCL